MERCEGCCHHRRGSFRGLLLGERELAGEVVPGLPAVMGGGINVCSFDDGVISQSIKSIFTELKDKEPFVFNSDRDSDTR